MKMNLGFGTFFLPALLLALSTSCKKEIKNETVQENLLSTSTEATVTHANKSKESSSTEAKMLDSELLKSVRAATSRFHSTTQAEKAGYVPDDHCVSVPGLGGMGYHWVNPTLVDGVFDPLKPEVVLYAPGPGGNLRLVAVEYIVLKTSSTQSRPMFGNQPFDIGGVPGIPNDQHWSLHVWLYENNPNGMFQPFNPNVTCP